MSEGIAVVRSGYERLRAGDLDGFLEVIDPQVEFGSFLVGVEGRSYRGHQGVRDWQRDIREAFEGYDPEPVRYEDFADLVLVTGTLHLRGTQSEVPVEQPYVQGVAVSRGKVVWWKLYRTREEAVAAHALAGRMPVAREEA